MLELDLIPAAYVPFFIFFARIIDVSIGTIRIMFVSKGYRGKAAFLSFIEVFIWIIIVVQIFQNLDNWLNYLAFAGGFAAGTYVGMLIEEKMKMGLQIFRIITTKDSNTLFNKLKEADFRVTTIDGEGKTGPVKIIFTVAKRKRWKELSGLISTYAPDSFYSVEDVRYSSLPEENIFTRQDLITRMLKLKKGL